MFRPACLGDPRFTLDPSDLGPGEAARLGVTICSACPLRDLCRDYAEAARPPAGVWAGLTYPTRPRKDHQ